MNTNLSTIVSASVDYCKDRLLDYRLTSDGLFSLDQYNESSFYTVDN